MDRYEIIKCIGEGAQGKVYTVREKGRNSRKIWVMKLVQLPTERKARAECLKEASLLRSMNHPGIVRCRESLEEARTHRLGIVMELCKGGDLRSHIKTLARSGRRMDEGAMLDLMAQLGLAVEYAWANKTLHRDIKSENIFLAEASTDPGGRCDLLLGDFGIARVLENTHAHAQSFVGTPVYMSPEVMRAKPYSHKTDMWSLGCVLYELITLKYAFEAPNLDALCRKVTRGDFKPVSKNVGQPVRNLLARLLAVDHRSRPSAAEMLTHPAVMKSTLAVIQRQMERLYARADDEDLTSSDGIATRRMIESLKAQSHRLGWQISSQSPQQLSPSPSPARSRPASPSRAPSPSGSRAASPSRAAAGGLSPARGLPVSPSYSRAGSPTPGGQGTPPRRAVSPRHPSPPAAVANYPSPSRSAARREPRPRALSPVGGGARAPPSARRAPSPRAASPTGGGGGPRGGGGTPGGCRPSSPGFAARGAAHSRPAPLDVRGRPASPSARATPSPRPVSPMEAAAPHLVRAKEAVASAYRALGAQQAAAKAPPAAAAPAPAAGPIAPPAGGGAMSFLSRMEREIADKQRAAKAAAAGGALRGPIAPAPAPAPSPAAARHSEIKARLRALKAIKGPLHHPRPQPLQQPLHPADHHHANPQQIPWPAYPGGASRRAASPARSPSPAPQLRRSNSAPPARGPPPPDTRPRYGSPLPPPLYGGGRDGNGVVSPGAMRAQVVEERGERMAAGMAAAAAKASELEAMVARAWAPLSPGRAPRSRAPPRQLDPPHPSSHGRPASRGASREDPYSDRLRGALRQREPAMAALGFRGPPPPQAPYAMYHAGGGYQDHVGYAHKYAQEQENARRAAAAARARGGPAHAQRGTRGGGGGAAGRPASPRVKAASPGGSRGGSPAGGRPSSAGRTPRGWR